MTIAFHNGADLGSTAYEPLDWSIERIRERTLSDAFRTHFPPVRRPARAPPGHRLDRRVAGR